VWNASLDKNTRPEPQYSNMVNESITTVPSWEQKLVQGNLMMACVMAPTCLRHINREEKSALERAVANGLAVPGLS
jgi:hypothetical protein